MNKNKDRTSLLDVLTNLITYKEKTEYFFKIRYLARKGKGLKRLVARYEHHKLMRNNACSIPFCTEIFEGKVKFPHGLSGIFISQGAKIGENAVIFHQVTIGSNTLGNSKGFGCPVIGKNVYIGCGAKIIGGVHIGDNVRIGANCVVTSDIPENSTVVLEKPRVIAREKGDSNSFVNYYDAFTEE